MSEFTRTTRQIDAFMRRCEQTNSIARKMGEAFCRAFTVAGQPVLDPGRSLYIGPPKDPRRIFEKYAGNIEKIKDGSRLNIRFDDPDLIPQLSAFAIGGRTNSAFADALESLHMSVVVARDFHLRPKNWGWVGLRIVAEHQDLSKYVPVELQITHRGMQEEYYPTSHDMYETVRAQVEDLTQNNVPFKNWPICVQQTLRKMQALHKEGAERFGLIEYVGRFADLNTGESLQEDPADDISAEAFEPVR